MQSYSEPEWRSKSLKERLAFAYNNKLFTDVTICVNVGHEKHIFQIHRSILANVSPVFEQHFREKHPYYSTHIEFKNVDPDGLQYVLRLLYHVPQNPVDTCTLLSAYHCALVLGMHQLENHLKPQVLNRILTYSSTAPNDFWKILELSRVLKLEDIESKLLQFAEYYGRDVLRAESLVKASPNTVKRVMDMENLQAPEKVVLENILRWRRGNKGMPFVDGFTRDLLGCVRFHLVSPSDFRYLIAMDNFDLSREDIQAITMYLENSSWSLPSWCSTKLRSSSIELFPENKAKIYARPEKNTGEVIERDFTGLLHMFLRQKSTDVCFRLNDERVSIKAHRWVLALRSEVFKRMFFGPVPDSRTTIDISIRSGKDLKGFEKMILYFYDDSNPARLFQSTDDAVKTLNVALKYGSVNLKEICMEYGGIRNAKEILGSSKNPSENKMRMDEIWEHLKTVKKSFSNKEQLKKTSN